MRLAQSLVKIATTQGVRSPFAGLSDDELKELAYKSVINESYRSGDVVGAKPGERSPFDSSTTPVKPAVAMKKPSAVKEIAKTVGLGTLGAASGMAAGYGMGRLIDAVRGVPVPASQAMKIAPYVGAGLGTSMALWKSMEAQRIKNAIESSRKQA